MLSASLKLPSAFLEINVSDSSSISILSEYDILVSSDLISFSSILLKSNLWHLDIIVKALNFSQINKHPLQMNLCGTHYPHRFLFVSPADLTSTFFGKKEIFLPHLGHFPS